MSTRDFDKLTHPAHGTPLQWWRYSERFATAGFVDKQGRPITESAVHNGEVWYWHKPPGNLPLYGLALLRAAPEAPVLVVQGEAAADAARVLFPDHVCMAWAGGHGGVNVADATPLGGRHVILWRDNDPGSFTAMARFKVRLGGLARTVVSIDVPSAWPPGWNLTCSLPQGVTIEMLRQRLRDAGPPPKVPAVQGRAIAHEPLPTGERPALNAPEGSTNAQRSSGEGALKTYATLDEKHLVPPAAPSPGAGAPTSLRREEVTERTPRAPRDHSSLSSSRAQRGISCEQRTVRLSQEIPRCARDDSGARTPPDAIRLLAERKQDDPSDDDGTELAPRALDHNDGADPPSFPVDILPALWRDWCRRAAHDAGAPLDYVALSLLGAAAGLIGSARWISPMPGWREPCVLWTALVGAPSSGRSRGMEAALGLVRDLQDRLGTTDEGAARRHAGAREKARTFASLWRRDVRNMVIAGAAEPDPLPDDAVEPPPPRRLMIDDPRLRSVADALRGSPPGLLLAPDALDAWLARSMRAGNDRRHWLKAWAGRRWTIARLRLLPVDVTSAISIVGTLRANALPPARAGEDDSVLARTLFACPPRSALQALAPVTAGSDPAALDALARLHDLPTAPRDVALTSEALALFEAFRRIHAAYGDALEGRDAAWWRKGLSLVLRLAGVLAFLAWSARPAGTAEPVRLSAGTLRAAIGLWQDYFWPHARAVLGAAGTTHQRHVETVRSWLAAQRPAAVSREQIRREVLSQAVDAAGADAVIAALVDEGRLQPMDRIARGPGRPPLRWRVVLTDDTLSPPACHGVDTFRPECRERPAVARPVTSGAGDGWDRAAPAALMAAGRRCAPVRRGSDAVRPVISGNEPVRGRCVHAVAPARGEGQEVTAISATPCDSPRPPGRPAPKTNVSAISARQGDASETAPRRALQAPSPPSKLAPPYAIPVAQESRMTKFGIGQSTTRVEDPRLLTGGGRYTDDTRLEEKAARAYVLRSPHAHAAIRAIDTAAAKKAPGMLLVLTGDDVKAAGFGDLPCLVPIQNRDGSMRGDTQRPMLAQGRVRHVGDPVALVVAETLEQAKDGAELIDVDYDPLPAVVDTYGAAEKGAPQIWDQIKGNECFDWEMGNQKATDAAFAKADRVVKLRLVNNRLVVNSMEPRGAICTYDAAGDRSTLWVSSQGVNVIRPYVADMVLKIGLDKLRVRTGDVGGGFGMKIFVHPEYPMVVWASRTLKRTVKWIPDRQEGFLSDVQGRDHVSFAEMALDKDCRFLGLRVTTYAALGAYLSHFSAFIPTMAGTGMLAGLYQTPAIYVNVKGVMTNTVPTDAYRGAGRPEAAYLLERFVDHIARETGLTPDEIRARNLVRPDQIPWTTALGDVMDSGKFETVMRKAMDQSDWKGFAARRAESKKRGKWRGIGLATYVEKCGGGTPDTAVIKFNDDDTLTAYIGNQTNGQGHETLYTQILSDKLGIDADRIRIVQGDSDVVPDGMTGGSRASPVGGAAMLGVSDKIIAKGKLVAATVLEASTGDIEYKDGSFAIVGTDRRLSLFETAKASRDGKNLPSGEAPGLDDAFTREDSQPTFPNGCHICELEVDPDTGTVSIHRYTVVDDFGAVMNPLLLMGQVHGGIGQGVGQALTEHTVYDNDTGQLLSGSFMDYAMPRADVVPHVHFDLHNSPCTTNPLGVKGAGEAGAIGAPPAVINAIVDALHPETGITHVDMPATAHSIWRAIQSARATKVAAE
ncbi:molybdopterin cofactor-binding domain-containing protein [Reyranella sp. CPCC 100927]|uniref:molybdopterin cofactor-binding domain-containing protein n=1 Tax=Reyranella sp. CPCC 100927 TaxID=2599616 RepID=UPI0015B682AA